MFTDYVFGLIRIRKQLWNWSLYDGVYLSL